MRRKIAEFQKKFNSRKPGWKFDSKSLQQFLGTPKGTTFNFLTRIIQSGLVEEIGKEGRTRIFRKVKHASFGENDVDSSSTIMSSSKMILVPEDHYKKLSESVVILTKELIEIKKQTVDFNWLQNVLGDLRSLGIKV